MFVASFVNAFVDRILPCFPERGIASGETGTSQRDLWRFSRVIAVSSALTLGDRAGGQARDGPHSPLSQFGIYVIAAALAAAPTVFAFNYPSAIVYPAVAEAWRDRPRSPSLLSVLGPLLLSLCLWRGGTVVGIRPDHPILYDPRYLPAGRYLSVLAISSR